jgi:phosphomannomutase
MVFPKFMKVFKRYDIRGQVPREINQKLAFKIGRAFGHCFDFGRIIVGRDCRKSSEKLKNSLVDGLTSRGLHVIDVGLSTTDMVAWAVKNLKADGGVMVTASHMPKGWNGFKFFHKTGRIYGIDELKNMLIKFLLKDDGKEKSGRKEKLEILEDYINCLISMNGKNSLDMKVVFDGFNGMGSLVVPETLRRLGANVFEINTDFENGFKKPPEPTEETMKELCQNVLEVKADLGIACDGDADRVLFVDERGNFVPGDESLILIAMEYARPKKKIVFSLDTSQTLVDYLKNQKRCEVVYSKIGDYFVTELMNKHKAVFGGQPNGHMKDPNFVLYDSGPFFATFFSSLLSKSGKSFHSHRNSLPKYHKVNFSIVHKNPKDVMEKLEKMVAKDKRCKIISTLDGLKFCYNEATILARPSGSENKVRLVVEADDEKSLNSGLWVIKKWV